MAGRKLPGATAGKRGVRALNDAQLAELRAARSRGESQEVVARRLGVDRATVSRAESKDPTFVRTERRGRPRGGSKAAGKGHPRGCPSGKAAGAADGGLADLVALAKRTRELRERAADDGEIGNFARLVQLEADLATRRAAVASATERPDPEADPAYGEARARLLRRIELVVEHEARSLAKLVAELCPECAAKVRAHFGLAEAAPE